MCPCWHQTAGNNFITNPVPTPNYEEQTNGGQLSTQRGQMSMWVSEVRCPNQQRQSTEESQLATETSFNPTRTTPQRKGPSVTKTQPAGPLSCLEHRATRILHCTIVIRAAVLMFPLYSRPSSAIRWGHAWRLSSVWFSRLSPHLARKRNGSIPSPGTHTGANVRVAENY